MHKIFTFFRFKAIIKKEIIQLVRDKSTFIVILCIPLIQIILFCSIINTNPKHLPTIILNNDKSLFSRAFIKGLLHTQYFDIVAKINNEQQGEELLKQGKATFLINIPHNFSRDLVRGLIPKILVQADATNPIAVSNALREVKKLRNSVLKYDLRNINSINNITPAFEILTEPKFNPAAIPEYFSIPGLIGLVLSTSMMLMTLISIVREKETGTMENLLTTQLKPIEAIIGKVVPFIFLSYMQIIIGLSIAVIFFNVPFNGNIFLLLACSFPFILANLSVGLLISTIVKKQSQAVQFANFYILPNVLFSGFAFPYAGLPKWAQFFGNFLPLTHYLKILIGIMVKGNQFYEVSNSVLAITLFALVIISAAALKYKQTLD